jgi:hypothetical protein
MTYYTCREEMRKSYSSQRDSERRIIMSSSLKYAVLIYVVFAVVEFCGKVAFSDLYSDSSIMAASLFMVVIEIFWTKKVLDRFHKNMKKEAVE